MACHDGLDQTNCNHAACTASRLTDRYLLHVLFCLHMCVCHERRGSFGIDSPETSDEPCHSESLTYHLILSHEVGMHGSTWEVKMHIGIYWMKDNQRVFIPFSPQVQSIELQSTHPQKVTASKSVLSFSSSTWITCCTTFSSLSLVVPAATGKDAPDSGSIAGKMTVPSVLEK